MLYSARDLKIYVKSKLLCFNSDLCVSGAYTFCLSHSVMYKTYLSMF